MSHPDRETLAREIVDAQHAMSDLLIAGRLASLTRTTLTTQQLHVLGVLVLGGERTATDLATTLGVTGATASGIVDRLVAAGLVERRTHPTDGRVRIVGATEEAAATLRELVAIEPVAECALLAGLTDAELEALATGTAALLRVMRDTLPPA